MQTGSIATACLGELARKPVRHKYTNYAIRKHHAD